MDTFSIERMRMGEDILFSVFKNKIIDVFHGLP